MLRARKLSATLIVAAILTGCVAPDSAPRVVRIPPPSRAAPKIAPAVPPAVPPLVPPTVVTAAPSVVIVTNALPVAEPVIKPGPPWPTNWVNVWVPLESWGRFNGLDAPRQFGTGFDATYQLVTTNGVLTLKPGGPTIRFAGLDFWLGFTPRLIQGRPYIHAIDAQKTLQPLLGAFPARPTNGTIVIDAGHGGKDGGTRSSLGEEEKHYALDWARRTEGLLVARGWNVVMTRTNDVYLSLAERVAIAERARADLFLSLHFNAAPGNPELAGVETYCLPPSGMPSTIRRGFADDPDEVLPNNAYDVANLGWATAMHRAILSTTGAADRGVCRARFLGVLRGQNRPAVLIEGGYLSNSAEARRISSSAHRQALAEGVVKALHPPSLE